MTKVKIGINGFGRIGRMVFRAAIDKFSDDIQVVGINDLLDPEYLAYMLKYDSVHGRFDHEVSVENGNLIVNGQKIRLTAEMDPANLKWNEVGAEIVVESTGLFLTDEKARKHIEAGARKVIMSAPSKDDTPMFVGHHLQRFLHHQLPGSHLQGSQRGIRYQERSDDHCSRRNSYSEDR